MTLTRKQILASKADRKPVRMEVPEWGGEIFVRVLSAKDQMSLWDGAKVEDMPVLVLLHAVVDEQGERIFTDDDFDALASEDFPVVMRLYAFAAKLNGFSNKEFEAAMASFDQAPDEFNSSG